MKPLPFAAVPLVLAAVVCGGCSKEEGVDEALAMAKIGLADAIDAARAEVGGGFALEAELEAGDGGPVYTVELLVDGGVREVVVDAVGGAVRGTQEIVSSPEEREVLDAVEDLGREGRISLKKALKRGAEDVGGGAAIEVDVELEEGGPAFVIVYALGEGTREAVVPMRKAADANEEDAPR
ncbi:MAG: PepSY domain-containing protein [Planctomycetota bacterium JB042]